MLRGSVNVVQANLVSMTQYDRVPKRDMYDYRERYGTFGKDSITCCPSVCISVVQSTTRECSGLLISIRNTITPSECKGLIGQV